MTERLRLALGDALTEEQRSLRDRIVQSRSSERGFIADDALLGGPFGPMLLAPDLGDALQELGARIRFGGSLPDDVREMVTLCVAGHRGSAFELFAHKPLALDAGVPEDAVETLSSGDRPQHLSPEAACAVDLARAILGRERIEDDRFTDAVTILGPAGLFEVTAVCGYYNLLADILDLFEVRTPGEDEPRGS